MDPPPDVIPPRYPTESPGQNIASLVVLVFEYLINPAPEAFT